VSNPATREHLRVMEDVRRVSTARGRAQVGAFLAEGRRLLERGLRAGWAPRELLVGADARREMADIEPLLAEVVAQGGRVTEAPDAELLVLSEGRRSGLLSVLFRLPPALDVAQLQGQSGAGPSVFGPGGQPVVFLVIVDVVEPGNVGALLRTGLASGAAAAICVGATDPFHPKAVRTSLGSLFKLPMARLGSSDGLIGMLKDRGIHCLATVARDGEAIDRAVWPRGSLALLVGNEGQGLPTRLRDAADQRVTIDLSSAADSFCVNAAAAVCLYELQRRRRFALDFAG
jgi:TrmH family RNA methyltransferase